MIVYKVHAEQNSDPLREWHEILNANQIHYWNNGSHLPLSEPCFYAESSSIHLNCLFATNAAHS